MQCVGQIFFAQHAPLPGADLRHHVGQQAQAVVGRQDGNAQQVAHGDQDEQVLHAAARLEGVARHIVAGHAVQDALEAVQQTGFLFFLSCLPL